MSALLVLRRVAARMLDIQVWDVAGTMTFYTLLSVLPAAVAMVSLVSLLGLQEQTVDTIGELVSEIFPAVDPRPYARTIVSLASTGGGLPGFALGTIGALVSASNGVAAFHRALHRVYDTREGRSFVRFRLVVLGETVVLVLVVVLSTLVVTVGGDWSERLGELVGIPRTAVQTFNVVKWPVLLTLLMLCVSLAFHLFPNVRLPRYRVLTLGSVLSVLVLFCAALVIGRVAALAGRVAEILPALNGVIGILVMLWLANIVVLAGAALDAEVLRARQLALGLPAWDHLVLEPQTTHALDALAAATAQDEQLGREVAEAARAGAPLTGPRSPWVVEEGSLLAVSPGRRSRRAILAAAPDPEHEPEPTAPPTTDPEHTSP
ncbi:YihY/virulence factor BrkB family protein [Brachybacterium sp. AOP25-B2-12]|uniref:YihY/virulence factor BrkB family protein n=1 Tax=Brachybacterium sp. AOP25-B2-12 TaxID=3457710 RepID=UPI0040337118